MSDVFFIPFDPASGTAGLSQAAVRLLQILLDKSGTELPADVPLKRVPPMLFPVRNYIYWYFTAYTGLFVVKPLLDILPGHVLADGTKVTLHIGTESGELKGECFTVFVEQGAKVKKGDKLMTFSPELLRQNPKTTDACILLIEEMPEGKAVRLTASGEVAPLTAVAEIA